MQRAPASRTSFVLPKTRSVIKGSESPFWDVKFYPYLVEQDDPVIVAIVGSFIVLICQVTEDEETGLRIIATFSRGKDKEEDVYHLNSCTWSYVEPDDPLLAVAGESGHVQVIKPMTGELLFTLIGHGVGVVNDLATHPRYPWIIASASLDGSIRIWDLRRASQPTLSTCVLICGHSLAHKEGLISIDWHASGRYIVSGGFDHRVCVWTIPDLDPKSAFWHEISKEGRKRSSDEVRVVYYPHFISSAIHAEKVDAVRFWDDFVVSKAPKEDIVVLWKITSFNSALPPPPASTAPKTQEHLETRNGFMRTAKVRVDDDVFGNSVTHEWQAPFERILQFYNKYSPVFYMRFGLLQPSRMFPDLHAVISVGNAFGELHHWDLDLFAIGYDDSDMKAPKVAASNVRRKGIARMIPKDSSATSRESSAALTPVTDPREASTEATSLASDTGRWEDGQRNAEKYPLYDFEKKFKYHKRNDADEVKDFNIRGVGWSVCGKWCVAVGAAKQYGKDKEFQGVIQILERRK